VIAIHHFHHLVGGLAGAADSAPANWRNLIMATLAETELQLRDALAALTKSAAEVNDLKARYASASTTISTLTAAVAALEAQVAAGETAVPQAVADLVAQVSEAAKAADALLPDLVVTPPAAG
jgi:ABC-type transporter Mla subunit MlaD